MKAIVFGSNGQDGYYLSKLLLKEGIDVIGISRSNNLNFVDISNYDAVSNLVINVLPDYIFHLASISKTSHNFLFENKKTISDGTINILESVKNYSPHSRVFISGSGLQFENNNNPINESDAFIANDAYSLLRIQSVYAARYYRSLGLKVYVGYFFNHDSPRRTDTHLTKIIFDGAKRIANGSDEKIEIGDLNAQKEYTYAGDIVEAVWKLVNQSKFYEANIGSGICYSVRDWLKICFEGFGLDFEKFVVHKSSYISPYSKLVSNNRLIKSIGWEPKISINQLFQLIKDGEKD
jgi:GDPmannose 4,6-dehydratase